MRKYYPVSEVITLIANEEIEKINKALNKNKKSLWICILIPLFFIGFFTYAIIILYYNTLAVVSLIVGIIFTSLLLYRLVLELSPKRKIYITDDGIKIPLSKRRKYEIIRFEWIEMVILNEMGGGSLYVDVFFKANGKKYIYRDFQRRIENYVNFTEVLKRKNIKVKVLEPSYKYQKKHDFGWIADMMRGREWV